MSGRTQSKNETSLTRAINMRGFDITPVCEASRPFLSGEPTMMAVYNRVTGRSTITAEKLKELIVVLNKVMNCEEDNPIRLSDVTAIPTSFRVN